MGIIKDVSKKLAGGVSLAVASAGLTNCLCVGAVDPAPPPLECGKVDGGQSLGANGIFSGNTLTITIFDQQFSAQVLAGATVTNVQGATLRTVDTSSGNLVVTLDLPTSDGGAADGGAASGSFTAEGTLGDARGSSCTFRRTFSFTLSGNTVQVAMRGEGLPLGVPHQATIALVQRRGQEVVLEARTAFQGSRKMEWAATAGELSRDGDRVLWRLPSEPGLYQVELVVDYGDEGLAFDAFNLEVA
ncbi:MAG: hypothetical protein HYZ28_00045 [Myxococcales bacterium]|nr:hypothetical protein [Myxococcales bacterium]